MGELRARAVTEVHVIVPEGIDDPARPSGGNTYDRQVCRGLTALGWAVHEHAVADAAALAHVVERIPDGAVVLLDGLIASPAPEALVPHSTRLRQVVLMHMPLGDRSEREVLEAAVAVVVTSEWARRRLDALYGLPAHVAEPGVDIAGLAPGTASGDALLCVAAVTPGKGHDVLLDGLATLGDLPWRCTCVGSLDRDPAFAAEVRRHALRDRVRFSGPRTGPELDDAYAAADLLVLASHAETYGMVVTEALARGLPVLAADVGGVTEALGHGEDGTRPGLLVPPGDPAALGAALRAWLGDAELRGRLRRAARERRASLRGWPATTSVRRRRPRGSGAMSATAVRVSSEWLDLREPADAEARSEELAERLARHLPAGRLEIHDLGGGSGAMGRWLAPRLPEPQHWVVHDRDDDLLRLASATFETRRSDITRLTPADLDGASAIVASALLDMLTADELARMLGACAGRPTLIAMTVAGRVSLSPADPLDAQFVRGVQRPPAPRRPARSGRRRRCRRSAARRRGPRPAEPLAPRCGPRRPVDKWFGGWVTAACEQEPALAAEVGAYRDRRLAQAAAGELAVTVDHADLLVLP